MPAYTYIAQDRAGRRLTGIYQGIESVSALRQELEKAGLELVKAVKADKPNRKDPLRRSVRQKELVAFTYQFAGMYGAGLTVIQCLQTIEDQTDSPVLREILADVRQELQTGASLKRAFAKYQHVFSPFFVGMIEAGETGGKLAEALQTSAVYLEKRAELVQKIRAAFVYPVAVAIVCTIVVSAMLLFVVPMFAKLYERLHVPLPWPTQVLILLSTLLRGWWILIVLAVGGLIWLARRILRRPSVRSKIDHIRLRLPVLGGLYRLILVSRFIRTFAGLAGVGVPLLEAIEVAKVVANNAYMTSIAEDLQQSIQTGHAVSASLKAHTIFPAVMVQMANSGERSGLLAQMLTKAVDVIDKEIDRKIAGLLVRLEPVLTLVMGLVIGLILLAVYMPMFDYMGHLK
ncbi:MAG: type II secretion system F family protein [Sedimentisphaerales bacterium]|jgi:type IV pilus assembly protein PilC|nr:type II secretion system F family protein [Sedimentisphaerales bacterium]